ncbi:MAG: DUF4124 domain-containing protein [Pseudomonadota bacterium]
MTARFRRWGIEMSAEKTINVLMLAVFLMAASSVHAQDKPLYRWVDDKGQVHYGDKVPPQESKQGRETISRNGMVTKVVPRELSGVELEQAKARLAAEKAAEEARQQRIAYDRYLLVSFASVADMQSTREERLTALDARIGLTQKSVLDNEKTLAELRERASNKPPDTALNKQIQSFEGSLIDNLQTLRKLREERTATEIRYTTDIERFKKLRAGSIKRGD